MSAIPKKRDGRPKKLPVNLRSSGRPARDAPEGLSLRDAILTEIFGGVKCTYCGESAETLDHVVPRSVSGIQSFARQYVVPCCSDCNNHLGARAFTTIGERALYLKGQLAKQYKQVLRTPTWEPDDIEDLGYHMQRLVKNGQWLKQTAKKRIEHCEFVALISPTIADVWSAVDESR